MLIKICNKTNRSSFFSTNMGSRSHVTFHSKYISKKNYDLLSDVDKESLHDILFSNMGYYALDKGYINVDEFLLIPIEGRKHLARWFYNAEEEHWEARGCRKTIDHAFQNQHFKLDEYIACDNVKQETLLKLLGWFELYDIQATEDNFFTTKKFLSLQLTQQYILLELFEKFYYSHDSSKYKRGKAYEINGQMLEFRILNNEANFISRDQYNLLSDFEKKSLYNILCSNTGSHALNKGYITVQTFLLMPVESQKNLSNLFYNTDEFHWDSRLCRDKIDGIFQNNQFKLDNFISFNNEKQKTFITLLRCDMVVKGNFSIKEFFSLKESQQDVLLEVFKEFGHYHYTTKIGPIIEEQMLQFRISNDDIEYQSASLNRV